MRKKQTIPLHCIVSVTWIDMQHARQRLRNTEWCGLCQKLTLHTVDDARAYIGMILHREKRGEEPRHYRSYLRPYTCPHGNGFHVGRDSKTARLIEERAAAGARQQKRSAA